MSETSRLRIAIHGAAGRMGRRLIALAAEDPQLEVIAALDSQHHPALGEDAGTLAGVGAIGVPLGWDLRGGEQAVIDFSMPEATDAILERCRRHAVPLVLATTGLTPEQRQAVQEASRTLPIVWAPSMSLAVNLTMKLAAIAASKLVDYGPGADVEIVERHHRFKEDAPSGTALRFGELIAEQMGQQKQAHGRQGRPGLRTRDEIGYHAIRAGDNPGEHTIIFGMMGETIELTVKATNRDCYALGALAAAKYVARQTPGLYSMEDVLGLH